MKVRTRMGKVIDLVIKSDSKGMELKERIEELESFPPAEQHLVYKETILADQKTTAEHALKAFDTLHLVLALR
ncbi:hypothetical protein K491DRAFT_596351 [Lophiostoma macrostomum CBS 122681]|uniref:Ubiquitin-like domain-containing protein n=1 Tax=Lophiostoma macrostomum CBS 122681 TaxID=1314788 RepID=A0A6A6T9L6_9PLEO|nr:hypothetical protein K491DRAFT_596351 [Lophiostoma macrostomum CBS 122681]